MNVETTRKGKIQFRWSRLKWKPLDAHPKRYILRNKKKLIKKLESIIISGLIFVNIHILKSQNYISMRLKLRIDAL